MNVDEKELRFQLEKYKTLYQISEKLHALMKTEHVLSELFTILRENYPNLDYYLLLSQETYSHSDLPIMEFDDDSENVTAVNAYVSGNYQIEQAPMSNHSILYAPLKGKQGVHGVLQVIAPNSSEFPEHEIEYLLLLANSTGSAFENARSYQQSQQLVANLTLLNETSQRLNSNMRLSETMTYITEQIQSLFDAQEIGYFLVSEDQVKVKVLPGSTPYFFSKQARVYSNYIKEKLLHEKDSLFFSDISLNPIKNVKSFHSIMAIPLIRNGLVRGFVVVMHEEPYFFSFESFQLLQSLAQNSSLALINTMLREELKKMVITDHLTRLHSRNYLDEKIEQSMKKDIEGCFILIDIDNFKKINDTHGHQVGDKLLIQVGGIIKSYIRKNDIGARWGGEELAIYLPRIPLSAGAEIASRLVKAVAHNSMPKITISCGVSYWHKDQLDSYQALFKRADDALYMAKGTGKNKVVTQGDNIMAG